MILHVFRCKNVCASDKVWWKEMKIIESFPFPFPSRSVPVSGFRQLSKDDTRTTKYRRTRRTRGQRTRNTSEERRKEGTKKANPANPWSFATETNSSITNHHHYFNNYCRSLPVLICYCCSDSSYSCSIGCDDDSSKNCNSSCISSCRYIHIHVRIHHRNVVN